jgi:hypothetical protein
MEAVDEDGASDEEGGEKEDTSDEAGDFRNVPLVRCVSWCWDIEMECRSVKKTRISSQ